MFGFKHGPFHSAERKMHKEMQAAEGSTIDQTFVRKLIAHHRGAIEMSQILLDQGTDLQIRRIATKLITQQTKDVEELEQLLSRQQMG